MGGKEREKIMQLFLDCDGVMADFDTLATEVFGLPPRKAEVELGAERFWCDLQSHEGFYEKLPLMPDAMELFEAVKHLNPIILTGLPQGNWAEPQKRAWGAQHFPHTTMICCMSKNKRNHMQPGDVLVDDWPKYKDLWEEAGGIFVLHTSAKESITKLKELGVL
jgi:hypothetical protein